MEELSYGTLQASYNCPLLNHTLPMKNLAARGPDRDNGGRVGRYELDSYQEDELIEMERRVFLCFTSWMLRFLHSSLASFQRNSSCTIHTFYWLLPCRPILRRISSFLNLFPCFESRVIMRHFQLASIAYR